MAVARKPLCYASSGPIWLRSWRRGLSTVASVGNDPRIQTGVSSACRWLGPGGCPKPHPRSGQTFVSSEPARESIGLTLTRTSASKACFMAPRRAGQDRVPPWSKCALGSARR
jgi:hypothetical protein